QPPAIGDALELMLAAILEDEPGAGHEVLHGACCQHLSGFGKRSEPRADVYRDSAHSIAFQLHLARMHACTDLDAQVPDRTHGCKSAPHRPFRAIEGGEDAVARGVDQTAPVAFDLDARVLMMASEEGAPSGVPAPHEALR